MNRKWILVLLVVCLVSGMAGVGEAYYEPTLFASDKEALEVLQSLKGSFSGYNNYPKQTVEIDRYGVRLFSEYIGTKQVWNTWEMYYMTVPDLRSEKDALVFKDVSTLSLFNPVPNRICVNQPNTADTTFCFTNETLARRFADAVATLAMAGGAQWAVDGGYTAPGSENWFRNKLGWKKETGAVIKTVLTGGPFDRAGIQAEDIVVKFGGQEIANNDMLWKIQQALATSKSPEVKVAVQVFRRGSLIDKDVVYTNYNAKAGEIRKLIDQPAAALPGQTPPAAKPRLGITIRALTEEDVKGLGLASGEGVLVTDVEANSTAQRMKMQVNDVIIEVNGVAVKNIEQLQNILVSAPSIGKIKVKRGESVQELVAPISI